MNSRLHLKISLILQNLGDTIKQNKMQVMCHKMLNLMFCINYVVSEYKWFCKTPLCKLLTLLLPVCSFERQTCQMQPY